MSDLLDRITGSSFIYKPNDLELVQACFKEVIFISNIFGYYHVD